MSFDKIEIACYVIMFQRILLAKRRVSVGCCRVRNIPKELEIVNITHFELERLSITFDFLFHKNKFCNILFPQKVVWNILSLVYKNLVRD